MASERKVRLQRQTSTERSDLCPAVLHSGLGNFAPDKDLGFWVSEGKSIFSRTGADGQGCWSLQVTSVASFPDFFFPIFLRGEDFIADFVCYSMHNVWLFKPTARVSAGTWQLSLLRGSSQVLKPGWKWVGGGTKFPTSLSFSCQRGQDTCPLKKPLCVGLWSLEIANKEGLDGEVMWASLEKALPRGIKGNGLVRAAFWNFPFVHAPAWPSFLDKTCLVTVHPGPLFFMRFWGHRSCMSQHSWCCGFGITCLHLHTL